MEDKRYNRVEKHYDLCQKLHRIYVDKNKSYGNSVSDTFDELGPISSVTRMFDKMKRIVHLVKQSNNDAQTLAMLKEVNEGIEDALLDIANYAIIMLVDIDRIRQGNLVERLNVDPTFQGVSDFKGMPVTPTEAAEKILTELTGRRKG